MLRYSPVLTGSFPLFYSMEQLVAYEEGEVTSQDDKQQSGEALPSAVDSSKTPDVSVGVPDLPTSSSSVGPSGPAPDVQTRNLPDLSAILADPTILCGVEPVPLPLWGRMRSIFDVQASYPRPLLCQLRNLPLVTSWERWLRSLQLFQGPSNVREPRTTSQGPVPAPGVGKLLPDRCYAQSPDPWTWPRSGPVAPPYLLPVQVPGVPPVHAGPARTFPDAVAAFPGPLPVLPTPGPATKSPPSPHPSDWPEFFEDVAPPFPGPCGTCCGTYALDPCS